jgi:tRNA modification GTPase
MIYKSLDDTIVALATPQGIGAIGVVRISGKDSIPIVSSFFEGKDLSMAKGHSILFGKIYDGKELLDEVLLSIFLAPKSYTGEDSVELSCHGSPYILEQVISLLIKRGARMASPGEFTMRAFLNGKLDLSQAEAVADLIASETASAHRLAMQQMKGGFSEKLRFLRQKLLDFLSLLELELDFSEEDVEFADRKQLVELLKEIIGEIRHIKEGFELGNALKKGIQTVIAGRPNAGKSTLLNALLEEERAIVSPVAGTTRDTIEEILNIEGIPFRIIDTAGIREAEDTVEKMGVSRTMEKVKTSSIILYVFDVIETGPEAMRNDLEMLKRPGIPVLIIANKMDLNPYTLKEHYLVEGMEEVEWIPVSAMNGMNIPYLKEKLKEMVLGDRQMGELTLMSNIRHIEALIKAEESLINGLEGVLGGLSGELIAFEIRHALSELGTITGEVTNDDLLGNIFGKFCIGK